MTTANHELHPLNAAADGEGHGEGEGAKHGDDEGKGHGDGKADVCVM